MSTESPPRTAYRVDLHDRVLGLHESIAGTRVRLHGQRETLRRLRAALAEMKELSRTKVPVAKEAAPDSARAAATSLPTGAPRARIPLVRLLPYAALAAFAIGAQIPRRRPAALPAIAAPAQLLRAEPEPSVETDDDRGNEAIALVHEWRMPGDDRSIVERLPQDSELPGTRPAWRVERTGAATYRVSFRPTQEESSLEFDVDLDALRVEPSPDTAQLLAPRLTALR